VRASSFLVGVRAVLAGAGGVALLVDASGRLHRVRGRTDATTGLLLLALAAMAAVISVGVLHLEDWARVAAVAIEGLALVASLLLYRFHSVPAVLNAVLAGLVMALLLSRPSSEAFESAARPGRAEAA
jgi:hypothetical protein